jgi:hypothetical protein
MSGNTVAFLVWAFGAAYTLAATWSVWGLV